MASTIKDLAEALSLSPSTVSRVLSGRYDHLYAEDTRRRILKTAKEHHFRPNPVARALVTGKTETIGVLSYALYPAVYAQTLFEINTLLNADKYYVQLYESLNRVPEPAALRRFGAWPVDGVLAFDSPDTALALKHGGLSVPLVCLGTSVPAVAAGEDGDDGIDRVWIDAYPATLEALRDMARQPGVRRLAFLGESDPRDPSRREARVRAYRTVVAEMGLETEAIPVASWDNPFDPNAVQRDYLQRRKHFAREAIVRHVRERGCPDALFASTDDLAIGAVRGLRDLGLSVPEDVRLMGFDGIEEADYLCVGLTTVALPFRRLCETAWRMLRRRIERPGEPGRQVTLAAEARIQASSHRP